MKLFKGPRVSPYERPLRQQERYPRSLLGQEAIQQQGQLFFYNAQVERMLEIWNTNNEFRMNYVKDNKVDLIEYLDNVHTGSLPDLTTAPTREF